MKGSLTMRKHIQINRSRQKKVCQGVKNLMEVKSFNVMISKALSA